MSGYLSFIAAVATERLWQVAVLTAAGAISLASPAEASRYYWSEYDPGFMQGRFAPPQQRPQRVRPRQAKKIEAPKESVKPQGPVVIAISIDRQTLKIYDANGLFAATPISTGMKGHPTPMGVFSVIQKHKLHHSNIYSNAPMPFMQRITWSGIAMHAGVLPGYPASHGCIRMPMAFAGRMWNWTRMGARVIVTPGEITPVRISHPLLAEHKVAPQQPTAANEPIPDAPPAAKADKGAAAEPIVKPTISEASLELRSTVGHNGDARPATGENSAAKRDQTRTADAGSSIPATSAVTMSDASSSAGTVRDGGPADSPKADVKPEAEPAAAKPDQTASSDDQPIETNPSEAATADAVKAKASASESAKPDDSITAATDASPAAPDVKKDQTRPPNIEKAVVAKPEPPKPAGRIAVFVSRKDGKLYVRENFKPLFDVPVTIAPGDQLLGTHVFTAEADKNDPNVLRWSVASLPVSARSALKNDDDERSSRRRRTAGVVPAEMKPVPIPVANSPTEALDRFTIPPDAMARIAEALGTGASIVVSDQGINQSGETGEGTDFIVSLR